MRLNPKIQGSPKQIEWAKDIVDKADKYLDSEIRTAERIQNDGEEVIVIDGVVKHDHRYRYRSALAIKERLREYFAKEENAWKIIDNKDNYTRKGISRMISEEENNQKIVDQKCDS